MGLFSGTKKVFGHVVNFKVHQWIDSNYHKNIFKYLTDYTKSIFSKDERLQQETFEQAIGRLQITEEDLANRKKEFTRLFIIFLVISLSLFSYTMFITITYSNIYSFVLGIGVTVLSLANTFKYHFWLTQINKKKLGLTFKEWLDQ